MRQPMKMRPITEGFFDSVTDNYDYDCVLLDFSGVSYEKFKEAENQILGNNNYLRFNNRMINYLQFKNRMFNYLIFMNTKIMSEYKTYRYISSDASMYDLSTNMLLLSVNDINCPCVIYNNVDIIQLESFTHVKLERLPTPSNNNYDHLYFATKRDIMIKKALHSTITIPKTKQ